MKYYLPFLIFLFAVSCSSPEKPESKEEPKAEEPAQEMTELVWEKNGIKVYEAVVNTDFSDASIKLKAPTAAPVGKSTFEFSVKNYELGAQTEDADVRNCANSGKGQHIHFILNNQPYKAHYDSIFEEDVPDNDVNILLAFLSRSYHESIKTNDASVLIKYGVGGQEPYEPMLFYSRPKGTYAGDDGKKLLLDFYLKNVSLSDEGHKVRATIDGEVFILPKWCPYFVEGLSVGEHTFNLELIDKDGNPVKNLIDENGEKTVGIYSNSGERVITVTAG